MEVGHGPMSGPTSMLNAVEIDRRLIAHSLLRPVESFMNI
jgi:hypothetical protein